jgi:hypothetical protein
MPLSTLKARSLVLFFIIRYSHIKGDSTEILNSVLFMSWKIRNENRPRFRGLGVLAGAWEEIQIGMRQEHG